MSILDTWNEWDMNKKAIAIIVAFFILAAILLLAFGGISSGTQVKVNYDGSWSGVIQAGNTVKVVAGYGNQTFDLDCDNDDIIHVQISKQDANFGDLNVQILRDGKVLRQSSASIPYGFVTLTYS